VLHLLLAHPPCCIEFGLGLETPNSAMSFPNFATRILRNAGSAVMRLRVSNALTAILWMTGILSIPCFAIAFFATGFLHYCLIAAGFIPVLLFPVAYVFFMLQSPDKLQSETYQIQERALDLIEKKGQRIPIQATSIEVITQPEFQRLQDIPQEE
jgi:hypothetical protein